MILAPEPAHMVRPLFVGLRGMSITMFALLTYLWMTGVTLQEHHGRARPYFTALGLSFLLHYVGAWVAILTHRSRQRREGVDA